MSDLPACETCGAVSDKYKEAIWFAGYIEPQAFICRECGDTTHIES